jgi:5'-3' exonuclease
VTTLIDGDVVAYRVAFATQDKHKSEVPKKIDDLMDHVLFNTTPFFLNGNYSVYLTGDGNFRYDIDETYKGNRTGNRPDYLPIARNHLVVSYGAEVIDGKEADDAIATHAASLNYKCTVASIDKDFLQLPCQFYNITKGSQVTVSEFDAMHFFYAQCMEGDRVDNVKGVSGIGPKKAHKLLEGSTTAPEMWDVVVKAFDGDEQEAIKTARLLWLQREENELWEPPNE